MGRIMCCWCLKADRIDKIYRIKRRLCRLTQVVPDYLITTDEYNPSVVIK